MSAMTATACADGVILLTDAAFYNQHTGVLTGFARKAWQVPRIGAAYSSRGFAGAFKLFELACAAVPYSSWDEFVQRLDTVWSAFDQFSQAAAPGYFAQIMICGISESRDRSEILWRTNQPKGQYGLDPFQTFVWTDGTVSFGLNTDAFGPEFNPVTDGISAFEIARAEVADLSCGESIVPVLGHAVGGWMDQTLITRHGIETQTVHTWPDAIGEPIQPVSLLTEAA